MASVSTGLASGFDYGSFIDQMMAIESRPKALIKNRNATLTAQQTALTTVNAKLLSLKLDTEQLTRASNFAATSASSSNESALSVSSGSTAAPGSYRFTVARLTQGQQTLSRGLADADSTTLGPTTFTFEPTGAKLSTDTTLSELNGGRGVDRGQILIADRAGASTVIDLSGALTVNDVVDAINNQSAVRVKAEVNRHGLKLVDTSGQTATDLRVENVGANTTATDLGLNVTASGSELVGQDINTLSRDTSLTALNDGLGVSVRAGVADFQIIDRNGDAYNVNLEDAQTLGDVIDAIDTATSGKVTAQLRSDQRGLQLVDQTAGAGVLTVTALNNSQAASALAIDGADSDGDGTLDGGSLVATLNSKMLSNLNGGTGIGASRSTLTYAEATASTAISDLFTGSGLNTNGAASRDMALHTRDGNSYDIDLDTGVTTLGDLMSSIESQTGGNVSVSIEDNRLRITDNTTGSGDFRIWQHPDNTAATDLGIEGDFTADGTLLGAALDPVAQVVPPGGAGTIRIATRDGTTTDIDLNAAESVSDVLQLINDSGANITAAINDAGNGITLTDHTTGSGSLTITDVDKRAAELLNIAGSHDNGLAATGNLQLAYINGSTRLDDHDVTRGKFTITDSNGLSATVDLTQGNEHTFQDVIDEINSRGLAVTARINDNGDGLLLEDTGSGGIAIRVEEAGSTTAADLGILGSASAPGENLDGSLEKTIEIEADDTLEDVRDKINDAKLGVKASIFHDGSNQGYRLTLHSTKEGARHGFLVDDGELDLGLTTLSEAQDALLFYGDPEHGIAVTSSSNTLDDVIPGATLTLRDVSDRPVTVTIRSDVDKVTASVQRFVDSFNAVIDTIDTHDSYDAETEERGLLLGDSAALQVRANLYRAVTGRDSDLSGSLNSLSQVGLTVGSGAQLNFDTAKFKEAYAQDPEAVTNLFTLKETEENEEGETITTAGGFGIDIADLLKRMTDSEYGVVEQRINGIEKQIQLNNDRMERYDVQLAAKRAQLETQFIAMERAIADMQSQGDALMSISNVSAPSG